ncbi:MAG: thioredoxin [Planctomycetota bacterium]|nr:MAG: thioredoxin [Planctomycetota bacterium]
MSDNIVEITDENFNNEVEKSGTPVLVDFSAEWCAPCKLFHPILESLANDYAGRVKVGKLNVDKSPQTANKFEVRSVPTILIFNNGKVEASFTGLTPKDEIAIALDAALT